MNSKILTFPLRIALIILIFGALFKVMHWPYAAILMFIGSVSLGLLYAVRFLKKQHKIKLDYVKFALISLWIINYLVNAFHLVALPYILEALIIILFVWWFIEEGVYYLCIGLTVSALFFALIFKIQHWPYGALLFTIGILMLNMLLIFDYFLIDRTKAIL
ncbi:MAG: hypothetical protein AB8B52_02705 [Winogradskyella sp.]|uniref:GldL-related protein n=1 Tax=Winogradskyella sp. TaxID=1883156 RepID=UPI0038581610